MGGWKIIIDIIANDKYVCLMFMVGFVKLCFCEIL